MTLAPTSQPTVRRPAQRHHPLHRPPVPRQAVRRGRRRRLRAVPVLRPLCRRARPLRHEPDQPAYPPDGAVLDALFGTDNLGRDMLSRCLYGAQISVIIAFTAATLATFLSVAVGIITGYLGGKIDLIRSASSMPGELSRPHRPDRRRLVLGPGIPQIIFTLGCLLGIAGSRIIRSAVVSVRENMYVHAAQSIGASTGRILLRHILPTSCRRSSCCSPPASAS